MVPETFYYQKVDQTTQETIDKVRTGYINLATLIVDHCPDSRSKSLALTHLEDSLLRAIQSLKVAWGTPTDMEFPK